MNTWAMGRIRRGKKDLLGGRNVLVLTTVGGKSGAERQTPVNFFPGEDGSWLIVASAAGAAANPAWYLNLSAHPDNVRIEVGGRTVPVTAEQLDGAERDRAWAQITASSSRFA
jgi:deazaflavin-dependent oxidoreductase (nitroreductase family)